MTYPRFMALYATAALLALYIAVPAEAATKKCFGRDATIVGTARKDRLRGTSGSDVIWGVEGKTR